MTDLLLRLTLIVTVVVSVVVIVTATLVNRSGLTSGTIALLVGITVLAIAVIMTNIAYWVRKYHLA